ncbi:MAG TPA: ABC transporter substrate-binding protein [Stellaceae bacterium]|jgi:peptide/nickel transport system substrate-binding protein|nr:ABC transporter substrate-binding protein [Stellaceae bacterium]
MATLGGGIARACTRILGVLALGSLAWAAAEQPAAAQKSGGILRIYHRDSPSSLSIHEEATFSVVVPAMGIFNNLVVFDPKIKQNSLDDIIPDLAESWSWDTAGTALTFKLRSGVKWHDGKPFTAEDVKCTWDLLQGKAKEKLRLNAREAWWQNLDQVTADSELQATFHMKQPQPAFLAMLASGFTPVYPCHITPAQMRQHPIGTGPFKFVEFKPNQSIKVVKNPDYWKPGRPYLDGIEYTIIPNRSTAILAFIAGNFDMTFPYEVSPPLMRDVKNQLPQAICEVVPLHDAPNVLLSKKPPFDNPDLRRAIAMSLDRKAFIDILGEGQGDIGTAMLPAPEGLWAMPKEMMQKLPGYDPDVAKSREAARQLMRGLGYGPDKHLAVKVSTRNISVYRDTAAIFLDQLKEIWIDAELELIETANWLPKLVRGDFTVALSFVGSAIDDPDQTFFEDYACKSNRNYTRYCNPEVEKLISEESQESDRDKRKKLVWEIDRRVQEDVVRPLFFHRRNGTCWRPEVKGINLQVNSMYNNWRMEDIWLDR